MDVMFTKGRFSMKLSDFDFDLPEHLIAQTPLEKRDTSKLLVLDRKTGKIEHKHFYDIIDYLNEGDILVRNNTKVIPARLFGTKKETNGHVEVLLLKELNENIWECLVGNARIVKVGTIITFGDGTLKAECIEVREEGIRLFKMIYEGIFYEILDRLGTMPLPPFRPLLQQLQSSDIPVLLMCEPQAHGLFPLARWRLCAPLDSVSAYDSYASVNSLINLLSNAFLHEILDKGRPRIHDIATLYQQLDELEQR